MIVDMGGGTCEIAVISLSGIVVNKSIRVAGDELDLDIVNYAKNKYNLLLGERSAEDVKLAVGNVIEIEDEEKYKYTMRGRDLKTGLPRSIDISPAEVREALKSSVYRIIGSIKDAIEETPAELMSDIVRDGLVIAGGTSQLRGLDMLMSSELKIPVRIAKDPMTCVVRGCGKVLDDTILLNKVKIS
jgi:rod shape-determining protein MreB